VAEGKIRWCIQVNPTHPHQTGPLKIQPRICTQTPEPEKKDKFKNLFQKGCFFLFLLVYFEGELSLGGKNA
jgi:hypothetical protein